jgi:GNAT superfamily N-acetyltransferase
MVNTTNKDGSLAHPFCDRRSWNKFIKRSGGLYNKRNQRVAIVKFNQVDDREIYLEKFVVLKKFSNNGLGTKIFNQFCKYLDRNKFACELFPTPIDHSSLVEKKLYRFYRKFGFRFIKKDDSMRRRPKALT